MSSEQQEKGRWLSRKMKPWHFVALAVVSAGYLALQIIIYLQSG